MKTFLQPEVLPASNTQFAEISSHQKLMQAKCNSSSNYVVVAFAHYRDLKVALDELDDTGFSSDYIVLVARNIQRHSWCSQLITNNYFDPEKFDFGEAAQKIFSRLFNRGKYLVKISGNKHDVDYAAGVMGRRQARAKVWHFE